MPEAIIVPSLLAIQPIGAEVGPAWVVRGELAGQSDRLDLEDWKRQRSFAPVEALRRRGLPVRELDLSAAPTVAARLALARLAFIDELQAATLTGDGELVITLGYHRTSGGGDLTVSAGGERRGFAGESFALLEAARGGDDDDGDDDLERLYDRVLQALTAGAYSLADVDLAILSDSLSATEGVAWEAEFLEVEARAADQRPLAAAILAAIDGAPGDADATTVAGFAALERRREPPFTLAPAAGFEVFGPPIEVPAGERWRVDEVSAWVPEARIARFTAAIHRLQGAQVRARRQAIASVAVFVALVLGIVYVALR